MNRNIRSITSKVKIHIQNEFVHYSMFLHIFRFMHLVLPAKFFETFYQLIR